MDQTDNDEAIARAIAESEYHSFTAVSSTTPPQSNVPADCPRHHGLQLYQASAARRVRCNGCNKLLGEGDSVWSCVQCNFDSCESCYHRGSRAFRSTAVVQGTTLPNNHRHTASSNSAYSQPSSHFNHPPVASHMCLIPCTIQNITVEMLVDTGAQSSVLSMPLVKQLGLFNCLDRRTVGVAAGVGRARICGRISNIVCAFGAGHVEFLMDFIVLDVSDPLVIIGLDQLRKYKCLVDMEREMLIFGGAGGVEVQMLPAEQQHFDVQMWNNGCTLM
ncbi:hypothetical protein HJC23_012068 [Cyclotella cryptica]|uniref:Peptidase A2 domain-containing protein n=1 Tax=Cyclotella cryptica TaxID=29204 RepID=A0ABD3PSS1_9STRA|eukprot:CCRYP_011670-RA/>CCRYP_011670-RA protein AED:0.08 eAED:0.08 QI:214/-1/1/1/-1/0/1/251/274